jgi:hypothetical protein
VEQFCALLGEVEAKPPILTSDEGERILASILPIEANAMTQVANLKWYVDWHRGDLRRYVDARLGELTMTARLERTIAPTLRRLKRALLGRGRD